MVFQAEDTEVVVVIVSSDSLEDCSSIVKRVSLYRNFGLVLGDDLPIKPDVLRFLTQ